MVSSDDQPPVQLLPQHSLYHPPRQVSAYAILQLLWLNAFSKRSWSTAKTIAIAFLLASAYGALDEVHQGFVPGRYASLSDVVADLTGCVIGVLVWLGLSRVRTKNYLGVVL